MLIPRTKNASNGSNTIVSNPHTLITAAITPVFIQETVLFAAINNDDTDNIYTTFIPIHRFNHTEINPQQVIQPSDQLLKLTSIFSV